MEDLFGEDRPVGPLAHPALKPLATRMEAVAVWRRGGPIDRGAGATRAVEIARELPRDRREKLRLVSDTLDLGKFLGEITVEVL